MTKLNEKEMNIEYLIKKSGVILSLLNQNEKITISELRRKSNLSFLYTIKEVKKLERMGFVKTEKEGKFRYILLTEKGYKVSEKIKELINVINEQK